VFAEVLGFQLEKRLFPVQSTAIARQSAVGPDNTMAGYDNRHRIGTNGLPNSTTSLRATQGSGYLSI